MIEALKFFGKAVISLEALIILVAILAYAAIFIFVVIKLEKWGHKKKYKNRRRIEKKVWREYFEDLMSGQKSFELRLDNFSCEVGDILVLREVDRETKTYTGRVVEKEVSYVLPFKPDNLAFWSPEEVRKNGLQIISIKDF